MIVVAAAIAAALAGAVGWLLTRLARPSADREVAAHEALLARVEDCLPKTQCAQCGYPGCRPYAEAVLAGETGIDRCPPGGERTVARLAALLDRPVVPIAIASSATAAFDGPAVARIVEADCIGCALCLPACPTDAIVGAHRFMHTVIAADCTGCERCLAPCPVDCIVMEASETTLAERQRALASA